MDLFRFFLARTDIISVLNLTGNSPVTTEDLDEMRSVFFFSPAELSRTVKLNGGDRIADRSGNGLFSLLFDCNRNLFGLNSIRG